MKAIFKRILLFSVLAGFFWMLASVDARAEISLYTNGMFFDAEYYASTYPDVAARVGTDELKLLEHYVKEGQAQGRLPYAAYGTGISPVTGAKDIALATSPVISIDLNHADLNRYYREGVQKAWADNNYADDFYGYGVTDEMLALKTSERLFWYFPEPVYGDRDMYMINAVAFNNHPEVDCWGISRDETGTTWKIHCNKNWVVNEDTGCIIPMEAWDILRNMLRYLTPDAEAIFSNVVNGYYRGFSPACPSYNNFYNLGSSLFMIMDDYGTDFVFRANDGNLDMEAIHNIIPSVSFGAEVPLTGVKRTRIDENDASLLAYKSAYESVAINAKSGMITYDPDNDDTYAASEYGTLYIFDDSITGETVYCADPIWQLKYDLGPENYGLKNLGGWGLEVRGWIDEIECDAIHQSLRYISPDAEALYAKIIQNEENGTLKKNKWLKVGSSQLYVREYGKSTEPGHYYIYFIR